MMFPSVYFSFILFVTMFSLIDRGYFLARRYVRKRRMQAFDLAEYNKQ